MNLPIRAAAKKHARLYSILGWSLLGLLCAVFFAYTLTVSLGAVHGIEFCPQTFDRRSYSFFEIPFLRWQVTGVRRETLTKTAETYLQSKKLVVPPPGKPEWHLVEGVHGPHPPHRGDAAILLQYLDAQDADEKHRWIEWSDKHAELAKVFWPAVQKLAIHELYVFLPEFFELAKNNDDAKTLKAQLDSAAGKHLLFLTRRLTDANSTDRALAALHEAAALSGETAEITALREQLRSQAAPPSKAP